MPPGRLIARSGAPMNMANGLMSATANVANPLALLFLLIGAASLYTGDYRWETWRLISARNGRAPLLLGKVLTFAALAVVAMIVLTIGAMIEKAISASMLGRAMTFDASDGQIDKAFALFGASGLRILQVTMLSLVAGVLSRSLLAALFVPIVLSIAQIFAPFALAGMGLETDGWLAFLINPGQGYDVVSAALKGGAQAPAADLVTRGWVTLAIWIAAPLAAALAWFQRQDLSKE